MRWGLPGTRPVSVHAPSNFRGGGAKYFFNPRKSAHAPALPVFCTCSVSSAIQHSAVCKLAAAQSGPLSSMPVIVRNRHGIPGQQLCLPQEKLRMLVALLGQWMRGRPAPAPCCSGTKRDLLSLIGFLNHAASVVKPGRTFLRSLIDTSTSVKALNHNILLPARARADVAWWYKSLRTWNGVSLLPATELILSDVSGSWMRGNMERPLVPARVATHMIHNIMSIAPKEFMPIAIAVVIWGHCWAGQRICC